MKTRRKSGTPHNNRKCCKCINHHIICDESPARLYKINKSKDYNKKHLQYLISNGLIGSYSQYVCNLCLEFAAGKLTGDKEIARTVNVLENDAAMDISSDMVLDESMDERVTVQGEELASIAETEDDTNEIPGEEIRVFEAADVIISCLENDEFLMSEKVKTKLDRIVFLASRRIVGPSIKEHSKILKGRFQNTEHLKSLNSRTFLGSCSTTLTNFIEGCTGKNLRYIFDSKELYRYAVLVESLYHLRNCHLVLPHCFMVNLIEKTVSGSKSVSTINGKLLPGASDTTLREWWTGQGSKPLSLPRQICNLGIWFDNCGKYIVKSYRVRGERNSSPTVITASQYIVLNEIPEQGAIQSSLSSYKIDSIGSEEEIQKRMLEIQNESISHFREYRFRFIASLINYMVKTTNMEKMIHKEIDSLNNDHLTRACDECGKLFPPRKTKCDSCGSHVSALSNLNDTHYDDFSNPLPKFLQIGQKCVKNTCEIGSFEPVLVNPNSFESVECVLKHVKEHSIDVDSPNGRKWIFCGADGPPACLMRRIKTADPDSYKWLAILTGKGHLKMNMLKSVFKLGNKIMFNVFGKEVLKFDTTKSYQYFIDCKDNHKSYQALEIFLMGTCMELIRLYSSDIEGAPTAGGFLKWTAKIENPTLKFVCQFTLNFVLAVYITRIGNRFNDARCGKAGRMKFFPLWFALNHPIYREIEYNDLRERATYHPAVAELRDLNSTFSTGNLDSNHQCGDFKLEERVKTIKKLSPKGKMDEKMCSFS